MCCHPISLIGYRVSRLLFRWCCIFEQTMMKIATMSLNKSNHTRGEDKGLRMATPKENPDVLVPVFLIPIRVHLIWCPSVSVPYLNLYISSFLPSRAWTIPSYDYYRSATQLHSQFRKMLLFVELTSYFSVVFKGTLPWKDDADLW